MLELETFKTVVSSTPLVSLDIIIRNSEDRILLGFRNNRPAQGYWFVPGGRILKDETFSTAFVRLTGNELGESALFAEARFLGPYQHFYTDNFSGDDFSTHYVVLGYELIRDIDISSLPNEQHNDYRWFTVEELLAASDVHQHTKDYFLKA